MVGSPNDMGRKLPVMQNSTIAALSNSHSPPSLAEDLKGVAHISKAWVVAPLTSERISELQLSCAGGESMLVWNRNSERKPEHFFFTAEARLQRCRNYIRSRKGSLKNNVLEYHRWTRQPGPYLDCKLGWWAGLRSRLLARSLPPRCQAAQAWEKEVAIPRLCGNIYYWKLYNYMWYHNEKLFGSIQSGWDDIMASAVEHGRLPPHQGHLERNL